jgi:shikimate kinase
MSKLPLYLIGFMACGKTKVGKSLAHQLNLEFIDLDEQIEMDAEKFITEIFEREGEKAFRKMEEATLKQTAGKQAIVALGGGTVCHYDNMELVKQQGQSVYLKVCPEILYGCLRANKNDRPLVKQLSDQELKEFINQKLAEREIYYEQADYILLDDNPSAKKIIELCF